MYVVHLLLSNNFVASNRCVAKPGLHMTKYITKVAQNKGKIDGVLGHDSTLLRLYWAGDNLGY